MRPLLHVDESGLACGDGGFHIDPWRPVPAAVVTHAHGDHARPGSGVYYCATSGAGVLRRRLGPEAEIRPIDFGEERSLGAVRLSLHPAGHILGSAQVRVEGEGQVWVASGDYKRKPDPSCEPFEVVPCDVFISEATFALPIYRWRETAAVVGEIVRWWEENAANGKASVLFCYSLGKAQRILAELAGLGVEREVYVHGTVCPLEQAYREAGVRMLPVRRVTDDDGGPRRRFAGELVLAPPSSAGTPWMRRFGAAKEFETGFASGWMRVRGIRRRRGYDRGFVLSDHADWDELLQTVQETGARRVLATHGYSEVLARYLRERGLEAGVLPTPYSAEEED